MDTFVSLGGTTPPAPMFRWDGRNLFSRRGCTETAARDVPRLMTLCGCKRRAEALPRKLLLFAVRHGEAIHNVRESEARKSAETEALERGLPNGSKELLDAKEEARNEALSDPLLHDAPLSEAGRQGAADAREAILSFCKERDVPQPTLVLTSPLQRALQTTALLFPEHPNVVVREELRERRTGLPCDERSPVHKMSRRPSFEWMRFSEVRRFSVGDAPPTVIPIAAGATSTGPAATGARGPSPPKMAPIGEEKAGVRRRAEKLLQLLEAADTCAEAAVCLVTHKGWLREFEHGPLGRPHAAEFGNCELRVFELQISAGEVIVRRVHPPEHERL